MLGLLGSRGLPRGGCQLTDAVCRPVAELGKHSVEVFSEVNVQPSAGLPDGGNGGDLGAGVRTAHVQPVLAVTATGG